VALNSSARTLISALSIAALVAGCRSSPRPPMGHDNQTLVVGRLARVNPRDIAIPPVANATGRKDLPLDAIRRAFQEGLVARRYSPLALEYVDAETSYTSVEGSETVEATYAIGALDEQGVLQITIHDWNDSAFKTHSRLVVSADVHLLDASAASGEALWGGPVTRTIDLDREPRSYVNERQRIERAIELFAAEVLASLPARDPRAASAKP
jgi:hypothetical protein